MKILYVFYIFLSTTNQVACLIIDSINLESTCFHSDADWTHSACVGNKARQTLNNEACHIRLIRL